MSVLLLATGLFRSVILFICFFSFNQDYESWCTVVYDAF